MSALEELFEVIRSGGHHHGHVFDYYQASIDAALLDNAAAELARFRELEQIAGKLNSLLGVVAQTDECGDGFHIEYDMTHECNDVRRILLARTLTAEYEAWKESAAK